MATQVINHTYKLKRGQQDAVDRANPFLEAGEPIVVFCNDGKTRLKIGDGKQLYDKLEFIGGTEDREVLTYPSYFDFPYPPNKQYYDCIFKATNEAKLWQWNTTRYKYEALDNVDVKVTIEDITEISGGTVADLLNA
jgi:hypothetical protein